MGGCSGLIGRCFTTNSARNVSTLKFYYESIHQEESRDPHCIIWATGNGTGSSLEEIYAFAQTKRRGNWAPNANEIENEVIFLALTEIRTAQWHGSRLDSITILSKQESHLDELRKPPVPKILKVSEAAKVLRVSSRKLYYLLAKGVFKRYKLPHTRTTFIKLDEVEKALGSDDISELLAGN